MRGRRSEAACSGVSLLLDLCSVIILLLYQADPAYYKVVRSGGFILLDPCLGVFLLLYPADTHRIARTIRHISLL